MLETSDDETSKKALADLEGELLPVSEVYCLCRSELMWGVAAGKA